MAGSAFGLQVRAEELEPRDLVTKSNLAPALIPMAGLTASALHDPVDVSSMGIFVTREALHVSEPELRDRDEIGTGNSKIGNLFHSARDGQVSVTLAALQCKMRTRQREARGGVLAGSEARRREGIDRMARAALSSLGGVRELTRVLVAMAVCTALETGDPESRSRGMAATARHLAVRSFQIEPGPGVLESRGIDSIPAHRGMALLAGGPESRLMGVCVAIGAPPVAESVESKTRSTGLGSVARFASDGAMNARQRKVGPVMVEAGASLVAPTHGGMTVRARRTELSLVRIAMATRALLELQADESGKERVVGIAGGLLDMTTAALDPGMLTQQRKNRRRVIEARCRSPRLHSVARQARASHELPLVLVVMTGQTAGLEPEEGP